MHLKINPNEKRRSHTTKSINSQIKLQIHDTTFEEKKNP